MNPEDRAQELELAEHEHNQAAAILPQPTRPSAKWCAGPGCGERIPEARRQAMPGVQLCLACQGHFERTKGRHAAN
jgi:phage/conjugal plasmid C-4 type zinc finger TraR family protein